MLDITSTLKILNSYNINSHKYGPTIYQNGSDYGLCLDIKDSTFGFLTRLFIFKEENNLEEFLKKITWYKKNNEKYNVKLQLDNYEVKNPQIKYIRNNEELSLESMLNIDQIINDKEEQIVEYDNKNSYLINIQKITEYLVELLKIKDNTKNEKNNLKITENDLKYQLLLDLTKYYGKNTIPEKKAVSLDNLIPNQNAILLQNNAKNIENKSLKEIENYLNTLITIAKNEELDEKHLVNVYSNTIYKYNINILNKQIEFVRNKIASEKNFSLKGSKLHNIDEELKSFLKSDIAPVKVEVYLNENKNKINAKYNSIKDINDAYKIISGNNVDIPKTIIPQFTNKNNIIENLTSNFNALSKETKSNLVLYNSLYKNICNYIIDNNYPEIEAIKAKFDFEYYYKEIEEIVYHENNSHYLINYFNNINFKSLDTYIKSLIDICKTVENYKFPIIGDLQAFHVNENNTYKCLSTNAINTNGAYLLNIPKNTNVLYIPQKLEIETDTQSITIIDTNTIYLKGNIDSNEETITVSKFNKIDEKYNNSDIIITKDLIVNKKITFHLGTIKGA